MRARNQVSQVKLEYYSLRFAKRLFKRFPWWKPYSGYYTEGEPGLLAYYLAVEVPSENPQVAEPLRITAYPGEVIVSWLGGAHAHFNNLCGADYLDYMDSALDFIERIVADKVVFGYYVRDGKPTGAGFLCRVETEMPVQWLNPEDGSVIMCSWKGHHDREVHA